MRRVNDTVKVASFLAPSLLSLVLCVQTVWSANPGAVRLSRLHEIERDLSSIRDLSFIREVPIEVRKADAILRYLEADLLRDYGEQKLHSLSLVYAKLGLLPQGIDLKHSLTDFYGTHAQGFYDPRVEKLILRADLRDGFLPGSGEILSQGTDLDGEVLAHELAHALQDQHFSLKGRLGPSRNDDRTLALRSIAEGDAVLAEFGYQFRGIDKGFVSHVHWVLRNSLEEAVSSLATVPRMIADKSLFEYFAGASFVSQILAQSGWSGVNHLYATPPLSTEQVLHPEKYLLRPDPPTRIGFRELSSLYGPDWKAVEENSLGEVMVQCLLKGFLSVEEAQSVANGWDGDRFWAFRRGDDISFTWITVWDSLGDAREFYEKYQKILLMKYPRSAPSSSRFYIEQRGRVVFVVEGLQRSRIKSEIETLWRGVQLEEEPFTPPSLTRLSRPLIRHVKREVPEP